MNTRRVAVHLLVAILGGLLLMRCGGGGDAGPTVRIDTISTCDFSSCTCTKRSCNPQTWTCPTRAVTTREGARVVTRAVDSCDFNGCGGCNAV